MSTIEFVQADPTKGHRAYVRAIATIPGMPWAVSGGYDGTVRVYREHDLTPVAARVVHDAGVGWIDVSHRGIIASAGVDGRIVFSTFDGSALSEISAFTLPASEGLVACEAVRWHGDAVEAGTVDGELFEVHPEHGARKLLGGLVSINSIRAIDNLILVATDANRVLILRRQADGGTKLVGETGTMDEHADALDIRSTGTGLKAAVVTHTNVLHLFDNILGGADPRLVPVGSLAHNSVVFRDANRVLLGGDDHMLFQVDIHTGRAECLVDLQRDIDCIAVTDDGHTALVATTGGAHRIDLDNRRVRASCQNRGALAAISTYGEGLVVGFHDVPRAALVTMHTDGSASVAHADLPAPANCSAAGAPIIACSNGAVVRVTPLGADLIGLAAAEPDAVCLASLPDGTRAIAVDRLGNVNVSAPLSCKGMCNGSCRMASRACTCTAPILSRGVTGDRSRLKSVAPLPDSASLLAIGKNRKLYRLGLTPDGVVAAPLEGEELSTRTINCVCGLDRNTIFVSGWDHNIHRLRVDDECTTFVLEASYHGHEHAVETLVIHEDRLVSASYDGTVRSWRLDANHGARPVLTRAISRLPVRRLAAFPAKGLIYAAGYDGTVTTLRAEDLAIVSQMEIKP